MGNRSKQRGEKPGEDSSSHSDPGDHQVRSPEYPLPDSILLQQQHTQIEASSGPIPSPRDLAEYGGVNPSFPERIMKMAEVEQQHRHEQDRKWLDAHVESMRHSYLEARIGQVFAFLFGVGSVGGAFWVAVKGHETVASIIGAVGLGGIIASFIQGRTAKAASEDRKKK